MVESKEQIAVMLRRDSDARPVASAQFTSTQGQEPSEAAASSKAIRLDVTDLLHPSNLVEVQVRVEPDAAGLAVDTIARTSVDRWLNAVYLEIQE